MEVLGCLGCPKTIIGRGVMFAVVETQIPKPGTVIPVGELWAEQPLGVKPLFLTTCCDPVDRAEIIAVLFILKLPKTA